MTPASPPPPEPTRVDSAFRNGTLAATGIVAAFSLGFLTRWAGVAGTWSATDFVSLVGILAGIAFLIRALDLLLDFESLALVNQRRHTSLATRSGALEQPPPTPPPPRACQSRLGTALSVVKDMVTLSAGSFRDRAPVCGTL